MNNVSLLGRLTANPELKYTQTQTAYTRFSVAVDRSYTKQGEERQTDFINIAAWGKTAEFICKYFVKGQRIALTGSIRTGSYTDQTGNKRYTTEVWANNVYFCDKPTSNNTEAVTHNNTYNGGQQMQQTEHYEAKEAETSMPSTEDLPF